MEFVLTEAGYEFDKAALMEYNHMSFGGPPVSAHTVEEADKLMQSDIKVSEMGNFLLHFIFPPPLSFRTVYASTCFHYERVSLI